MRRLLLTALPTVFLMACATTADARPDQRMIFEASRELRSDDAGLRARTLDEITGFGVDWLRVILYWNDVAPQRDSALVPPGDQTDPAYYDWTRYDRIVREADARGLRLLLTISGPVPRWATRDRRGHVARPSAVRFGRFAEAVGRRYGDVVDAYSIWNEPNHPKFLQPQWTRRGGRLDATSARLYRRLFQKGRLGLEAAGVRRAPILFGETAPRGTRHVVRPLAFLRRALCLDSHHRRGRGCQRIQADGYAHHAYTTHAGPSFRPPHPDDVTIGVLTRLNRALARAGRAGAVRQGLPIWLTEFGIQSVPDRIIGVSETRQAEYRAISERLAERNRRVVAFSQYLMRDDLPDEDAPSIFSRYPGFESGLRHSDGDPKRAYAAFPLVLVATEGRRRTVLWGRVRPAEGRTTVSIDVSSRGSARWRFLKRDRTNVHGSWTTTTRRVPGRRYRVRWSGPDGTRLTGPLTRAYRAR